MKIRGGKQRNASVTRMISPSIQPPRKPAIRPTASWGKELRVGFTYLEAVPLFSIAPGLMITLVVIAFNFLGDGLRDALDPRFKGAGPVRK